MAIAEAEKAILDNAYQMTCAEAEKATADETFNNVCPQLHHCGFCPSRKCGPFRCTFCRFLFETREKFEEHQNYVWTQRTKCELCGNKLNCMALKEHMKTIHGKDLQWLVKAC